MTTITATLADGNTVEFLPDPIGEGGMKLVFFTADKKSVICFYKDQNVALDPNRGERLSRILNGYNPTTDANGNYFKNLFCWPTAIVVQPALGILTPVYPNNYFFSSGNLAGKEKESTWFIKQRTRTLVAENERGKWLNYLQICIRLARAIRRMHNAGLAHSDLSNRNVLIDPSSGQCLIIDIDSLVVPNLFPPDVLGTRGYIAPEILSTIHLPIDNPQRKHPSINTDKHALSVLIYQYLFGRHPLEGPKIHPANSAEEQERLEMGSKALFIEHPNDNSNRPKELDSQLKYTAFGHHLSELFERAFVKGLHSPDDRPSASDWEKGLINTFNLLHPCHNKSCPSGWFILHDTNNIKCPFCNTKPQGKIPVLQLRRQVRSNRWTPDGKLVIYHNMSLHKWHAFDNIFPGENADPTRQAYFVFNEGKWLLINQTLTSLTSPGGNPVPVSPEPGRKAGGAIELQHETGFKLSQDDHGRRADVEIVN